MHIYLLMLWAFFHEELHVLFACGQMKEASCYYASINTCTAIKGLIARTFIMIGRVYINLHNV